MHIENRSAVASKIKEDRERAVGGVSNLCMCVSWTLPGTTARTIEIHVAGLITLMWGSSVSKKLPFLRVIHVEADTCLSGYEEDFPLPNPILLWWFIVADVWC